MTVVDAESRFHVLAVDDSVIDRKLIEMLLKTSSYQVTTVDSGSKALEVLGLRDDGDDSSPSSSSSPDHQEVGVNLIITDYCMPGMTGYDLLRRVKGSSSLKDIPVVIMSSENVPARINRCLEDGAEEFFLKPVKLADMKKLKSHLVRRKQQPQLPQPQPQPQEKPLPVAQQQQQKPAEPVTPQLKPEPAPVKPAEEAGAAAEVVVGFGECSKKRKAAAMEQEALSSNPRLSSSSGLAVET
uniref:Uncharacterized protein n=1 Tax=Avena sativa TaxID=4498 RepID=A0ACD5X9H3_AVESA